MVVKVEGDGGSGIGNHGGCGREMVVMVVATGSPISARQYLCMHTCKFSQN